MKRQVLCVAILLGLWQPTLAADYRITPGTNLESIVKKAQPGDVFILADGTWTDANLKFEQLAGTADSPIRIQAEHAGQVVFSGKTSFRFSGSYVVVSGLVFRNMNDSSDIVQLRTHSERLAHHCRVTQCRFEQGISIDSKTESRWLSVYGTHNQIDHCSFQGKVGAGTTLVVWVNETPGHHRIDHNYFGPRPVLGKNGGETIRIGTSEVSELTSASVVEDNYFYQCNGEAEVVSNKSCENIYRHNFFLECSGALTLRHGHRCLVDSNVFLGGQKSGTGGVRIIGREHHVVNNYFDGLRGDAERAALSMMNGVPNSPLNEYAPVHSAIVEHNTFVDCKVSLELGVGAGKKQSVVPENCKITFNVFAPGKWPIMRSHVDLAGFAWLHNKIQADAKTPFSATEFEPADLQMERDPTGILRPASFATLVVKTASSMDHDFDGQPRGKDAICGCDAPGTPTYPWPTPALVGPEWSHVDVK